MLYSIGIFSISKHKSSKPSQDDHKLSNAGSASSGGSPGGGGGSMGKEKVKGQMERRLSLISGIALIVGTMIGWYYQMIIKILYVGSNFITYVIPIYGSLIFIRLLQDQEFLCLLLDF